MTIILCKSIKLQNRKWVTIQAPEWFVHDPVARRYDEIFEMLDWSAIAPEEKPDRLPVGRLPHPESAYIKAFMVMIIEKKAFVSELYKYLIEHPALVWVLGFRFVPATDSVHGFDVARSIPCERHFRRKLHQLNLDTLNDLLRQTIQQAQVLDPNLGETIAIDTKHIYAWVRENNPKAYVKERYDPQRQPRSDPDCRLGLKRRSNQTVQEDAKAGKSQWLWGYGTGIAVAPSVGGNGFVVADFTQPFHENDVTYGLPLVEQSRLNTSRPARNIIADAAFDAWYMYQCSVETGGIAAIALNSRGKHIPTLDERGHPLCRDCQQSMDYLYQWMQDHHRLARFQCPHCQRITKMNIEPGHIMRVRLDRQSEIYKTLYSKRTTTERINSQATALGIEHPKQRRQSAIAHRNRLTYIILNLMTLQRIHQHSLKIRSPDNAA